MRWDVFLLSVPPFSFSILSSLYSVVLGFGVVPFSSVTFALFCVFCLFFVFCFRIFLSPFLFVCACLLPFGPASLLREPCSRHRVGGVSPKAGCLRSAGPIPASDMAFRSQDLAVTHVGLRDWGLGVKSKTRKYRICL